MTRVDNFSAGPAALPLEALELAQRELLNFENSGASIMEQSHRGPAYDKVHHEALDLLAELLGVPDTHQVLFLQGGATGQFAQIPLNFLKRDTTGDYLVTGAWGAKAVVQAKPIGAVRVAYDSKQSDLGAYIGGPGPSDYQLSPNSAYLHYTTNETIHGVRMTHVPETGDVPLIADMSSDILSEPVDISRFAFIYAGAQKNLGPSGATIVIANKSFLESGRQDLPPIYSYWEHAKKDSLLHTPPSFSIYLVRNVLRWLKDQGGVPAMLQRNHKKASMLYRAIDESDGFYHCPVQKNHRSLMNVVFRLPNPDLEAKFVAKAADNRLLGLKGHRSVGGIRASIYNAVSPESVERLVSFMADFAKPQS